MRAKSGIGDYIRKQRAQGLPFLSARVGHRIRSQKTSEILPESTGDGILQRKRDRCCAQLPGRNAAEVGTLRQNYRIVLARSHRSLRRGGDFLHFNWIGQGIVLGEGRCCAKQRSAEQQRDKQGSETHFPSWEDYSSFGGGLREACLNNGGPPQDGRIRPVNDDGALFRLDFHLGLPISVGQEASGANRPQAEFTNPFRSVP